MRLPRGSFHVHLVLAAFDVLWPRSRSRPPPRTATAAWDDRVQRKSRPPLVLAGRLARLSSLQNPTTMRFRVSAFPVAPHVPWRSSHRRRCPAPRRPGGRIRRWRRVPPFPRATRLPRPRVLPLDPRTPPPRSCRDRKQPSKRRCAPSRALAHVGMPVRSPPHVRHALRPRSDEEREERRERPRRGSEDGASMCRRGSVGQGEGLLVASSVVSTPLVFVAWTNQKRRTAKGW
mmetsp:Transcript_7228/g.45109  ORF Transcript_7228/g.45109 Transcript_7228/m.45109 type:complete len:232 (-) Transcript_7228:1480-2175(-)